ncbi:MAG: c-type cytochrome [Caldilineaceae bacterium]|nr:c-type cytochrome [Caldilineaceae bacterium]
MKRLLKWLGFTIGALLVVLIVAAIGIYVIAGQRLNRTYSFTTPALVIPTDEAAIARGKHLVETVSECTGCHAADFSGRAFWEDGMMGYLYSANLTSGAGGIGATYSDEDWIRVFIHGVNKDGRPLVLMPSHHYRNYSDEDLAAMIAYLKTQPPVDSVHPAPKLGPLSRTLLTLGALPPLPAERIDHDAPRPSAPAEGPTADYGAYLVQVAACAECHGDALAGGQADPNEPAGANLTPGGRLGDWTQDDFFNTIRTGVRPDGTTLHEFMPWYKYRDMSDTELEAIWHYLESLEALPSAL